MADHLERAFAFMRRGDVRGTDEQPFRFGTAIFTPELPLRYDSNLLYVQRSAPAAELAAEADRLFEEAGLSHRALLFKDAAQGERAAADLPDWEVDESVVMVQLRQSEEPVDTSSVAEVGHEGIRPARRRMIATFFGDSPEVADQLLDYKPLLARWVTVRGFAALADGEVVSYADLYTDGADAQIEDVATLPEHRGRGHAKAVVARAADEARASGADFVFLVADANDWPKDMYGRLGFDIVGRYVKLRRREAE
jgi:ribosomal protein S18 acetylase RimI-like enzyme